MKIAIIGCGYIGKHLLEKWKNHHITTTTSDPRNIPELNKLSQKTIFIKNGQKDEFKSILEQNDKIVLTITSDNKNTLEENLSKIATAIKEAARSTVDHKTLIYTSRAEVYGDHNGLWVDETSKLKPKEDIEKKLIETEEILLSLKEFGWSVCILRLAEVYGPGYELSQKILNRSDFFAPGSGKNYTNMIHLTDIIGVIDFVLTHELEGIYNLADDDHPILKDLLMEVSKKLKIKEITWDPKIARNKKGNMRVSNHKIKSAGYSFIHLHRVIS